MFNNVQPQKYYMRIARQIKDSIYRGELKPGDKLPPERMLSEQFRTSRACIREAISALEMLGLIECKGRQGNFISQQAREKTIDENLLKELLSGHDPLDIFEARLQIEPSIAALAAERATEIEIALLKKIVDKLEACTALILADDWSAIEIYMEEERQFALAVSRFSHNTVLHSIFSSFFMIMRENHWKELIAETFKDPQCLKRYMETHLKIYQAIEARKPDEARKELETHIKNVKKEIF